MGKAAEACRTRQAGECWQRLPKFGKGSCSAPALWRFWISILAAGVYLAPSNKGTKS
jgi:hypothetical protein